MDKLQRNLQYTMMTYLAIYFAIGIIVSGAFGRDEGSRFTAIGIGFLWPLFLLFVLIMILFNLGR